MVELTAGIQIMDFQHFCGTVILASPSIRSNTCCLRALNEEIRELFEEADRSLGFAAHGACRGLPGASFSPTKSQSSQKCPGRPWDVVLQFGKESIFPAIDAGKTLEELGDIKLHDAAVDERRIGAKTPHSESSGAQVGRSRRLPQIVPRAR